MFVSIANMITEKAFSLDHVCALKSHFQGNLFEVYFSKEKKVLASYILLDYFSTHRILAYTEAAWYLPYQYL